MKTFYNADHRTASKSKLKKGFPDLVLIRKLIKRNTHLQPKHFDAVEVKNFMTAENGNVMMWSDTGWSESDLDFCISAL